MPEPENILLPIARSFDASEVVYWQISQVTGISQDYRNDCKLNSCGQVMLNISTFLDPDALKDIPAFSDFDPVAEAQASAMDLLESLSSVRTYSDFIREKVDRAKSKEEPRWQRFEVEQFICPQTRTAADRLDQLAVLIPDTVRPESNIDLDLTRLLSLLREAAQIIDGGDEGFKFDSLFNLRRVKEDLSRAGLRVI